MPLLNSSLFQCLAVVGGGADRVAIEFFERVCRDDPGRRKIALVATAHHLLRVMLSMLQTGECWRTQEVPPSGVAAAA